MAISIELRRAFNRYRAFASPRSRAGQIRPAWEALKEARAAMEQGMKHYASSPWRKLYPAVSWQDGGRRIAYVESPESCGLRLVGRVQAEPGMRNGYWSESSGWYTYPDGETYKDGSGLCYGLVYQLPARGGQCRFVAGYEFGGHDGGPTIDFSDIREESTRYSYQVVPDGKVYQGTETNPADMETARDMARAADSMAARAAEKEREYQTAWQAGNLYGETRKKYRDLRKVILRAISNIKGNCETLRALPENLREMLSERLEELLEERRELLSKMESLKEGDYDGLQFWNRDETLQSAFNEGAGI